MKTLDTLVKNTAIDSEEIGIKAGDFYDVVGKKMSEFLLDLANKKVDVSKIDPTQKEVLVAFGVELLIEKISSLSVSDIKYSEGLPQVKLGINPSSGFLVGTTFNYSTTISGSSIILSYDTSNIASILPDGYSIGNVEVTAIGDGGSLIQRSDTISGSVIFPINKLPGYFDVNVTIFSTKGVIRLSAVIAAAVDSGSGSVLLDIKDSNGSSAAYDLGGLLISIVSNLSYVMEFMNSLKAFNVSGLICHNSVLGILGQVASNSSALDSLMKDSETSGKVYVKDSGCETKSLVSIQEAVTIIEDKVTGIRPNSIASDEISPNDVAAS